MNRTDSNGMSAFRFEPQRIRGCPAALTVAMARAAQCTSEDLARMKVNTLNSQPGDLSDYNCPDCLNRGVSYVLNDNFSIVARDCRCRTIRRTMRDMKASGMENLLKKKRFDNFETKQPWQRQMLEMGRQFADKPEGWLLVCGQSGCGKTHICSAVCRELLEKGMPVKYLLWREAVTKLKSLAMDADRSGELKDAFKTAPVLYIDDLFKTGGSAPPTPADIGLAYEILNRRSEAELITVISTEYSPEQLYRLDQALGGRIIEKADGFIFQVGQDIQKNYRLRNVQNC